MEDKDKSELYDKLHREIEDLRHDIKERKTYAKHGEEHRFGGFDPTLVGAAPDDPPAGGVPPVSVFETAVSKTIASGAINITGGGNHFKLTGEGGALDNLDTITGGVNNRLILIRKASGGAITIRSGQGNIYIQSHAGMGLRNLTDANDVIILNSTVSWALLRYDPDTGLWTAAGFEGGTGDVGGWVNAYTTTGDFFYPALSPTGQVRFNDSQNFGLNRTASIVSDALDLINGNTLWVAPETGTTDNLGSLTMAQGNTRGDWCVISSSSSLNTITVKHNSGTSGKKFLLQGAADIALSAATDKLMCWYDNLADSGNGAWIGFAFGTAGTGGGGPFLRQDGTSVLTGKWDQSGAFDINQRGGNLLVANAKALKVYSDNSATPSTLVASLDGVRGDILAAGHASIGLSPTYDGSTVLTFNETRTSNAWATLYGSTPTTVEGIAATIGVQQSAAIAYPVTGVVAAVGFSGNFTASAGNYLSSYFANVLLSGGADTPIVYGFESHAQANAGSVVTDRYGSYVFDGIGSGTYTNQYGFYVPAFTKGGTNWAFYSVSAASFFGGAVTLGGVSAPATPASDTIVVYPETGTDLLKAKDDNGAVYALTHLHTKEAVMDVTVASTTVPYHVLRMPAAGTITDVRAKLGENKTNGATSSIFDVHKIPVANENTDGQGTTIFTTSGNRPTITNGNMVSSTTAPDVTTFAAGDWLAFYTDQSGTTATAATVNVTVRFT